MRSNETSSSSAITCDNAVSTPVPKSTLLVKTVMIPSEPTTSHESSWVGNGLPLNPDCSPNPAALICGPNRENPITRPVAFFTKSLREIAVLAILCSPRFISFRRRTFHGADNSHVRSAAAEVGVQRLLDFGHGGVGIAVEQSLSRHDHAVRAIAALSSLLFDKRRLNRSGMSAASQTLERGNVSFSHRADRNAARPDGAAFRQYRARSALRHSTAKFGTVQLKLVSQHV